MWPTSLSVRVRPTKNTCFFAKDYLWWWRTCFISQESLWRLMSSERVHSYNVSSASGPVLYCNIGHWPNMPESYHAPFWSFKQWRLDPICVLQERWFRRWFWELVQRLVKSLSRGTYQPLTVVQLISDLTASLALSSFSRYEWWCVHSQHTFAFHLTFSYSLKLLQIHKVPLHLLK